MKRYLMTILAVVLTTLTLKAMPYEMAREEAMYLTDKMAYELNLNQRQYEYAYEINLDYLMSLNRAEDAFGMLLHFRNEDLRHILYDWQWAHFIAVDYFFRPVSWRYGRWYYPIYTHYAPNLFYYTRPRVYIEYRGGHGRVHYNNSFYAERRPRWDGGFRGNDRGPVAPGRGHGEMQFGGNRPNMGGMNQGNRPNMGGMNQGNRPDMNQGNRPNMGGMNQNTQQPNMGGNRGNTGLSNQRGNATSTPSRGHTDVGTSRGNANMGNVRNNPGMGNTRGNANAGSNAGNARGNAGRGAR